LEAKERSRLRLRLRVGSAEEAVSSALQVLEATGKAISEGGGGRQDFKCQSSKPK